MPPLVSIVLPLYNCEKTLSTTLQSVVDQSYSSLEIILINDGSSDATAKIGQQWAEQQEMIKYHQQENQGQTKARNNGAKKATGTYLLFLDADDTLAPSFIEKCVEVAARDNKTKIVYTQSEFTGARKGEWKLPLFDLPAFLLNNCIPITALIRREDFETIGGFDEQLSFYEDWELWLRMVRAGAEIHRIDETLFYYYQHHQGASVTDLAKENRKILSENKLAIYTKHYDFYSANGFDFESLLKAYPYQKKYYNLWFKKIFYSFKKKKK